MGLQSIWSSNLKERLRLKMQGLIGRSWVLMLEMWTTLPGSVTRMPMLSQGRSAQLRASYSCTPTGIGLVFWRSWRHRLPGEASMISVSAPSSPGAMSESRLTSMPSSSSKAVTSSGVVSHSLLSTPSLNSMDHSNQLQSMFQSSTSPLKRKLKLSLKNSSAHSKLSLTTENHT